MTSRVTSYSRAIGSQSSAVAAAAIGPVANGNAAAPNRVLRSISIAPPVRLERSEGNKAGVPRAGTWHRSEFRSSRQTTQENPVAARRSNQIDAHGAA